jgi:thiamine pyrophosphokinase
MSRAILFANGQLPSIQSARSLLRADDYFVAADGGTRNALALGVTPHVLIGDLDSITDDDLLVLEKAGTQIHRHPAEKDETDLELALRFVIEGKFGIIVILGGLGGRFDQTLGNISILSDPSLKGTNIRLDDGVEEVFLITHSANIDGMPGDTVSLLPLGLLAEGVVTDGLRYPLRDETLYSYRARGMSNVMLGMEAAVSLKRGALICVHTRKGDLL